MATKSITKNIEITDSIKAKRLVEALEVAERIGEDMPEILNKKQLEDAIKCRDFNTGCYDKNKKLCSAGRVGMCTENAAYTALAYRAMLKRLEWSMPEDRWGGDYCPMCGNSDLEGHTADCELAALLKEGDEQDG